MARTRHREHNVFGGTRDWNWLHADVELVAGSSGETVEGFLADARTRGLDHQRINARINADYVAFATRLQQIIDPQFALPDRPARISPNWFAIGFHVSLTVGRNLAGLKIGRDLLGQPARVAGMSTRDVLRELGLPHHLDWVHRGLEVLLRLVGIRPQLGAIVFGALQLDYGVLWNPITVVISVVRLVRFLRAVDGSHESAARAILDTAWDSLGDGNQAIYADIATAAQHYLRWRSSTHRPTPDGALEEVELAGCDRAIARSVYQLALDRSDLQDYAVLGRLCPPTTGVNLCLAGYALYERAHAEPSHERANRLVHAANLLLALREQRDLLQPQFDLDRPGLSGGRDGERLFGVVTPLLRVHFGRLIWDYAGFRHPTDGNWGVFEDRWPAIMAAFDKLYAAPRHAWQLPSAYRREAQAIGFASAVEM